MQTADQPKPTILDDIQAYVEKYVALSDPAQATVLALYVMHTHAFEYARATPYLYVTSAEKQSGKTRTLETLETICRDSVKADNLTSSVMFRVIEHKRPTLMVDEVDTIFSGAKNEELRGVLNSGYKRGGNILRSVGNPLDENGGIASFNTFCPKILAGIDNAQVPDTIRDRSIRITLRRKAPGQVVQEFYAEDVEVEAEELVERIGAWIAAHDDKLRIRPDRIDGLSDRANEISRPLLAIAQATSAHWYQRAVRALLHLQSDDAESRLSPQAEVLLIARNWMDDNGKDRITSRTLCDLTGRHGKQIGVWMKAYEVRPGTYAFDGVTAKGYLRASMQDAFDRYLPAPR